MRENKINIDLIVPYLDEKYNLFIPINKSIGEIIALLSYMLNEMSLCFPYKANRCLLDVYENKIYSFEETVKDAGIKNGAVLVLL